MTWFKIDDGILDHPVTGNLSADAFALFVDSLAYCSRHLTDGKFPRTEVHFWAVRRGIARPSHAKRVLTDVGLWTEPDEKTYEVAKYLQHNRSRSEVERTRESDRNRKRNPSGIRPDSGHQRREEKRRTTGAPTERKRDELFDALVEVCRIDPQALTDSSRGAVNKALKELRQVGATPDGIRLRASQYARLFPGAVLTSSALAKHWASLGAAPAPSRAPVDPDASFRRAMELSGMPVDG